MDVLDGQRPAQDLLQVNDLFVCLLAYLLAYLLACLLTLTQDYGEVGELI